MDERLNYSQAEALPGTGVICETWALQAAVIPAKAGIYSASLRKCAADRLDSRFRGNDCFHRPARKINFPQMTSVPFAGDCVSCAGGPPRRVPLRVAASYCYSERA